MRSSKELLHENIFKYTFNLFEILNRLLCLFRSHLDIGSMLAVLPNITRHLLSDNVVVQTYASICIERFLTVKDKTATGESVLRVKNEHIVALLNDMFSGLFTVLDNTDLPDNDYVMK